MNFTQLANSRILDQPIYQPGKPIELVARELGLNPALICKLASNENPLGPSPEALIAAQNALKEIHRYPDGSCLFVKEALADFHKINKDQFIIGNGSNEIIELLAHVFISENDEVLFGEHSFVVYRLVTLLMGGKPITASMPDLRHDLNLMREKISERTKLIFLPSPNNPTGTSNTQEEILDFIRSLPEHVIFCFDEAYAEYLEDPPNLKPLIEEGRKIIGLRTFSKIHGLAGLRIGYGYGCEEVINLLQLARQPFNVNSIAASAAIASLNDHSWLSSCRQANKEGLIQLQSGFDQMGLKWIPSEANFILVQTGDGKKFFINYLIEASLPDPCQTN